MWVLSTRGFYSVVAHHDDPEIVLVRARTREDLESLAEILESADIVSTPERDYPFRIHLPRDRWVAAASELAQEIDYPNFKSAVALRQSHQRAALYGRIWSTLRAVKPDQ